MPCRVCGDPATVRSHLWPRAFALDARRGHKHLQIGDIDRTGYGLTQGGAFDDDILCAIHEAALALLDDYGVEFVRTFAARRQRLNYEMSQRRPAWVINDIDGNRLVRFAASVLWRWNVSSIPGASRVQLGPYEAMYRAVVFDRADCSREPALGLFSYASQELKPDTVRHDGFLDL